MKRNRLESGHDFKARFHRVGKSVLRKVARDIGLDRAEYDIRSNKGGVAVLGEVTLHADGLYVVMGGSFFEQAGEVMYRTCRDRKDYSGGPNQWSTYDKLVSGQLDETFRRMVASRCSD